MAAIGEVLKDAVTPEIADAWGGMYWEFANVLIEREESFYHDSEIRVEEFLHSYQVVRREQETLNTFSLYLAANATAKPLKFQAGQYVSVKVALTPEAHQLRPYSISDLSQDNTLRITIKQEATIPEEPSVSGEHFTKATVGSNWQLSHPAGEFTIVENSLSAIQDARLQRTTLRGSTRPRTITVAETLILTITRL